MLKDLKYLLIKLRNTLFNSLMYGSYTTDNINFYILTDNTIPIINTVCNFQYFMYTIPNYSKIKIFSSQ